MPGDEVRPQSTSEVPSSHSGRRGTSGERPPAIAVREPVPELPRGADRTGRGGSLVTVPARSVLAWLTARPRGSRSGEEDEQQYQATAAHGSSRYREIRTQVAVRSPKTER